MDWVRFGPVLLNIGNKRLFYLFYNRCYASKAPDVFILSSLLVSLSVAFKNSFYMPKGSYFSNLWPNIWIACIAVSGTHKSTALDLGSEIAMQIQLEAEEQVSQLQNELDKLEEENADQALKRKVKEEIAEWRRKMTLISPRITPEAMIQRLGKQSGGAFFLDELGAWVEGKSKNYLRDFKGLMTEIYDCRRIDEETKTYGKLTCERPYLSVCGVSTPTWLEKAISGEDVETGFFARFLVFYPKQERITPPAMPVVQEYDYTPNNNIRKVIDYVHKNETKKMYLAPDARKFFDQFHFQLYKLFDLVPDNSHHLIEPFVKRWSPAALKIGMLFQPFWDPDTNLISLQAMVGAAELIEHVVRSTLFLLQTSFTESEFQKNCRKVLEYIARRGGQATRQQILSSKRMGGGTKEYDEVLLHLIESGQINVLEKGPKKDWIYSLS